MDGWTFLLAALLAGTLWLNAAVFVRGGTIIGVGSGSQFSTERFQTDHRKAFFGKALVVIRKEAAQATVRAGSPMLKTMETTF